jgi:peptide/nickel transport system substrate-binding protein
MRTPFRPIGPLLVALTVVLTLGLTSIGLAAGTIRIAITQDEGTLTPYTYQTGYPGYELMTLVYDQLFLMDQDLVPQPWLAESLVIGDDDVTYTLTLREGVTWHDGEPLTADDVVFSIGYFQTHVLGRFTTSSNKVAEAVAEGPRTVVLTLAAPDAGFVQTALADLPMLPQHVWQDVDEPRQMGESMGSGPYMVAEYRTDQFYRLVANPNYWGPTPTFDTIIAPIIRDETATFQALIAGDIDAAVRPVPAGIVESFSGRRDIELARGSNFGSTILIMNVDEGGLADAEVRRVIAGSIDYGRLIDTLLLGFGTAGTPGFLHPATPFANPATAEYASVSTAEAASRLEAAGYTRGADGVYANEAGDRLDFVFLAPSNNPTRLRAAELIGQDLNAAGIRVTVRAIENEALVQRAWPDFDVSRGRDYQLSMFGWSAPVNAQANLRGLLHSNTAKGTLNLSGYADAEADRLTDEAAVATDPEVRRELLYAAQERLAEELPLVTLFYQDGIFAYRPAAFDDWSYMAGQGIINKGSFVGR